jgi:hypothetical protein
VPRIAAVDESAAYSRTWCASRTPGFKSLTLKVYWQRNASWQSWQPLVGTSVVPYE